MIDTVDTQTIADQILMLERSALDRWGKGDPGGFLEVYATDITYFDPLIAMRIDGHQAHAGIKRAALRTRFQRAEFRGRFGRGGGLHHGRPSAMPGRGGLRQSRWLKNRTAVDSARPAASLFR